MWWGEGAPWYTFLVWWPAVIGGVYMVADGKLHPATLAAAMSLVVRATPQLLLSPRRKLVDLVRTCAGRLLYHDPLLAGAMSRATGDLCLCLGRSQ